MRVRSRSLMVALVVVALIGPSVVAQRGASPSTPRLGPARFLLHRRILDSMR